MTSEPDRSPRRPPLDGGISVYLYFEDHPPPHIHVRYAGAEAKLTIDDGMILEGVLPPRALRLASEWAIAHRSELRECWARAMRGEDPGTIEPLR